MSVFDIKDRVPTEVLENGAVRYGVYNQNGSLEKYQYMKREDEPLEEGTAINKVLNDDFQSVAIGYNELGEYEEEVDYYYNSYGETSKTDTTRFEATSIKLNKVIPLDDGNIAVFGVGTTSSYYLYYGIVNEYNEKVKSFNYLKNSSNANIKAQYFDVVKLKNGKIALYYTDTDNSGHPTLMVIDQEMNIIVNEVELKEEKVAYGNVTITELKNGNIMAINVLGNSVAECVVFSETGEIIVPYKNLMGSATGSAIQPTTAYKICTLENGNVLFAYLDYANSTKGTYVGLDENGEVIKTATVLSSVASNQMIDCFPLTNGRVVILYQSDSKKIGYFTILNDDFSVYKTATSFCSTATSKFAGKQIRDDKFIIDYYTTNSDSVSAVFCMPYSLSGSSQTLVNLYTSSTAPVQIDVCGTKKGLSFTSFILSNYPYTVVLGTYATYWKRNYILPNLGKPLTNQRLKIWSRQNSFDVYLNQSAINDVSNIILQDGKILSLVCKSNEIYMYWVNEYGEIEKQSIVERKTGEYSNYIGACLTDDNEIFLAIYDSTNKVVCYQILDINGNTIKGRTNFDTGNTVGDVVVSKFGNGNICTIFSDRTNGTLDYLIFDNEGNILTPKTSLLSFYSAQKLRSCTLKDGKVAYCFIRRGTSSSSTFYCYYGVINADGTIAKSAYNLGHSSDIDDCYITPMENGGFAIGTYYYLSGNFVHIAVFDKDYKNISGGEVSINSNTVSYSNGAVGCCGLKNGNVAYIYCLPQSSSEYRSYFGIMNEKGKDTSSPSGRINFTEERIEVYEAILHPNGNVILCYGKYSGSSYRCYLSSIFAGNRETKNSINGISVDTLMQPKKFYEMIMTTKLVAKEVRA